MDAAMIYDSRRMQIAEERGEFIDCGKRAGEQIGAKRTEHRGDTQNHMPGKLVPQRFLAHLLAVAVNIKRMDLVVCPVRNRPVMAIEHIIG